MSADFFIPNPEDTDSPFSEDWEVAQWIAEAGATITKVRFQTDTDHPSCLRIVSDTDEKGVYHTVEDVLPETKYLLELSYKVLATQELDYLIYDNIGAATIVSGTLTDLVWSYYYQEFDTPAGCTEIIIYLRAGTSSGLAIYVDDLKLQGNILEVEPDDLSYTYPKDGTIKRTLDRTLKADISMTTVEVNMGFPHLSDAGFDRIRDFHRSKKQTYFDDGKVPAVTERATMYVETQYDFTDIGNPSSTHIAYEDKSASEPAAQSDFETTEIDTADYNVLDDDDSNSYQDSASVTGHYQYHKFIFDCSEDYGVSAFIRSFKVTYKGKSNDASSANQDGVTLYLWNVNAGNWVAVGATRVSTKETITFSTTKPEQAQMFVDIPNGEINVLVQSNGKKGAGTALNVDSYYVEVTINKSKSATITLINRAILTSGDVIHVKNLSNFETLIHGLDYRIGDDAKSVHVDGISCYFETGAYLNAGNVLDGGTSDLHLALWFKTSGSSACMIVGKRNGMGAGTGFSLEMLATGKLKMEIEDTDSDVYAILGNTAINDGEWHFIQVIVDRDGDGNCKIYLGGVDDTLSTSGGAALTAADETLNNAEDFVIGADSSGSNHVTGYVTFARIQIGGTAPTAPQLARQLSHVRDFSSQSWALDGTRSYWRFDDTAGALDADADGMITDGSGSGNHLNSDGYSGDPRTYRAFGRTLAAGFADVVEAKYDQYYRVSSVSFSERRVGGVLRPVSLQLRGLIGID